MPHSRCSRAPAELINHFPKASQKDELGPRLCSLQNDLAWSLGLHVAMGGGWHPCCGHVSGPVTQHLLCQVPANTGGRGRDLYWCCSAARTPEDCWPQEPAHVPLSLGALAAVLPYQAPANPDMRKLWCLQEGMTLFNTRTKKSNWQRCFLGATSSLGSKSKFLALFQ